MALTALQRLVAGASNFFNPAQPAANASIYDLARADAQRQSMSALGAGLIGAAVPQTPLMRAQALQQAFGNMGNTSANIYNAAQLRLMEQKLANEQKAEAGTLSYLNSLGQREPMSSTLVPSGSAVRDGGFSAGVAPMQSMAFSGSAPAASDNLTQSQLKIIGEMKRAGMAPADIAQSAINFSIENLTPKEKKPPIEVGGVLVDADTFQPILDTRKPPPDPLAALRARAEEAGLKPGTKDYQDFMARGGVVAPVTNVNINQEAAKKFEEEFAKSDATTLAEVTNAGLTAGQNLARLSSIENLLSQAPTGGVAALKQVAGRYGIATEGLSEIQAAQALINQLVPGQRPAGSGPMSDRDVELFKQSLPAIINQAGGNALIVDTLKKINQYDLEGSKIVQQVRDGTLSRAEGFAALQNRPNPLAGQMLPAGAQTQGGSLGFTPEEQAVFDKYNQ
jgi:hypothetical protein